MRKIVLVLLIILAISCGESQKEYGNFMQTYKEILLIRESYADTTIANQKVKETIKQHGYSLEDFQKEFFELSKNDKEFVKVLDSMRKSFKIEIDAIQDSIRLSDKKAKSDTTTNTNK